MADRIVVHVEAGDGRVTEVGERVFIDVGDVQMSVPVPKVADRRALGAHLYRRCTVQVIFLFDPEDEHDCAAPEVTA